MVDIFVCDRPGLHNRFIVTYHLLSYINTARMQLSTSLGELSSICSITSIYRGANWLEREIWDMYGILFNFHPDLRRILTDYGFCGYPLRKDFPLSGFIEIFFDIKENKIIYDIIELAQEYRNFDFRSP